MIHCCGFSWDQGLASPSPKGKMSLRTSHSLCGGLHRAKPSAQMPTLAYLGGVGRGSTSSRDQAPCLGQNSTQGTPWARGGYLSEGPL